MIRVYINKKKFFFKENISILEACNYVGLKLPRFCYHESLSIAGNCRICLVEVNEALKLVASCAQPIENDLEIFINTPAVKKARENVLEAILLHHPLDCPICDQGGECDLQDQVKLYGSSFSKNYLSKRGVENKYFDPFIKTIMTRCIHCTRCVRFGVEVAGVPILGTLNRGQHMEIGNYIEVFKHSEISGNVIDLCPVGALTAKPYAFQSRPWELKSTETIDLTDSLGSNIYINYKESEIVSIVPKNNKEINDNWISNKARFYGDSNSNYRLTKSYSRTNNKFSEASIHSIWNSLKESKIENKKVLYLINDELDLDTIHLLKKLELKNNKISVRTTSSFNTKSNMYLSGLSNKITDLNLDSEFCVLFGSNVRIENALINLKLRVKYSEKNLKVVSSGLKYNNNFSVQFLNLNSSSVLDILEGKDQFFSKNLFLNNKTLFIFGESFFQRFSSKEIVIQHIKKYCPTSLFLILNKKSNSESNKYFNISSVTKQDLISNSIFIFCGQDDTLQIRNYLYLNNKTNIWFHSHGSQAAIFSDYIIPTLTSFEKDGIYLNLEKRPQLALKVVDGPSSLSITVHSFVKTLFFSTYAKSKYIEVIDEMICFPKLFNKVIPKFSGNVLKNINFFKGYCSQYIFKPVLENFYLTNSYTKYSPSSVQCSQDIERKSINF